MIYLAGCRCGQVIFGVNGKCSVASISNVRVMGRSLCTNCESASAAVSPIIVMQSVKRSEFSVFCMLFILVLMFHAQRLGS